jgi:hypothetical protein
VLAQHAQEAFAGRELATKRQIARKGSGQTLSSPLARFLQRVSRDAVPFRHPSRRAAEPGTRPAAAPGRTVHTWPAAHGRSSPERGGRSWTWDHVVFSCSRISLIDPTPPKAAGVGLMGGKAQTSMSELDVRARACATAVTTQWGHRSGESRRCRAAAAHALPP